jgi:hypothetical protein
MTINVDKNISLNLGLSFKIINANIIVVIKLINDNRLDKTTPNSLKRNIEIKYQAHHDIDAHIRYQ